jgi:DNA polymerase III subunit alpha
MGKKLPEEMAKERGKFVAGCMATVGSTEEWADELFDKIAGFAGYGFNKSHSVEYTLISYQAMFLKTYFPVEFFASALSLMKEDKLPAILKDCAKFGVEVDMPDINLSTDQFEILTDTRLAIPFNRVKGIGENTAKAIMEARKAGPFSSRKDLEGRVERRKCNIGHIEKLDKIGAFARIEPGQPGAKDPIRIKDQRDLIPGLIASAVPIERKLARDKETKAKLGEMVASYRAEHELDGVCVKPMMGGSAKFMVIYDAPNSGEDRQGQMTQSEAFSSTLAALLENELEKADGYYTALIKRPKEGKQVSAKEIDKFLPYLKVELDLLKPPVIVMCGSQVVRHFIPDLKGKASEHAGKVVYHKELDANLVIGFNPGEIYHDPDKQELLNDVFKSVAELVS